MNSQRKYTLRPKQWWPTLRSINIHVVSRILALHHGHSVAQNFTWNGTQDLSVSLKSTFGAKYDGECGVSIWVWRNAVSVLTENEPYISLGYSTHIRSTTV